MDTGELIKALKEYVHSCLSISLYIDLLSKDRIVSSSNDETIQVWDINTGENVQTLIGHTNCVNCICVKSLRRITPEN